MEKKINIAEILKDKPEGIKLYSPIFGNLTYIKVEIVYITLETDGGDEVNFLNNGKYMTDGECLLFPSKSMRDWSKFAWKKGDVLISNDGRKNTIFAGFTDDAYTSFKGVYSFEGKELLCEENDLATQDYTLEDKDAAQHYFNTIERKLDGKLNMETLKITPLIPKPFDKVIVRSDEPSCVWHADIFSHIDRETLSYVCIGDSWTKCLPYNKETAKLIGTTNNYEED